MKFTPLFLVILLSASHLGCSHFTQPNPLQSTPSLIISKEKYNRIHSSSWHRLRGGVNPTSSSSSSTSYWQRRPPSKSNQQGSSILNREAASTQNNMEQEDRERTKEAIDSFLTRDDRTTFIARVYAILTGQLLITALSIFGFSNAPNLSQFMIKKPLVMFLSLILSSVVFSIMSLSEEARRSSPRKWQLLSLFTIGEAIAIGFIGSLYSSKTVISAMTATALGTISVTLYTLMNKNPKRDLSQWGASLSSIGMIFVAYAFIQLLSLSGILPPNFLPFNETLYCIAGATLFSVYLAYHTRLVVSGKHTKYQLNEKDYVFGAMLLYNDIVNLFLYLLRLLGDRDD